MRFAVLVVASVLLAACSPEPQDDSVEALMADHERLAVLRSRCKLDHARVADAARRRFMLRRPAASE